MAASAARASYNYAEWSVGALLMPQESEETFQAALETVRASELPYPVVNCFVPADLKITGPNVDDRALQAYVVATMMRAEQASVQIIVFGSGGARQIPDGFDTQAAHEQLVSFCSMAGPVARHHGVTVVIEPLNRAECNVLNSVGECAALVREVDHPAIRLLVDTYHMLRDGDSYQDIAANGDILSHAHIATVPNRLAPGAEPCDFTPFFYALKEARYSGRVSIEGKIPSPDTDLPVSLALMREKSGESE